MPLNPTEWMTSVLTFCRRIFLFTVVTSVGATLAHSAVLRLNPGDNADNVITFDGAFTATVVQSAAGVDITIPGVKFTLDCQGDPTDSCTVTVGSATVSADAPTPTPTPTPGPSGSNPDPAGNDDEDCVADGTNFGTVYGCNNDGSTGNSSPPAPDESVDDSPSEDTGSSGDGFDVPPSGDSGDEGSCLRRRLGASTRHCRRCRSWQGDLTRAGVSREAAGLTTINPQTWGQGERSVAATPIR
jgi:hypothetical protein